MSKTKIPNIKATSVPSAYDTPLTTLEYLQKVQDQNAQVLAREDEIEESLNGLHNEIAGVSNSKVSKSGDTMTGRLDVPTLVTHEFNAVSPDENTHVEANNNGFVAEVSVPDLNKKFAFVVGSNGKIGLNVHDVPNNRDTLFMFPNADDYGAGTYELATKDDIPEPSGGSSLLEDIEDSEGHKAYEEFLQTEAPANTTPLYVKAIRNGLVLEVICYTQFSSVTSSGMTIGIIPIPQYISDKIIFGQTEQYVIGSVVVSLSSGGTYSSTTGTIKKINDKIYIMMSGNSVMSAGYARCHYTLGL